MIFDRKAYRQGFEDGMQGGLTAGMCLLESGVMRLVDGKVELSDAKDGSWELAALVAKMHNRHSDLWREAGDALAEHKEVFDE